MRKTEVIYLVGPMGAGKSTIGRLLAETLGVDFFDVDREIEERAGVDIPWIFDMEGEEGFREREAQMLRDLSDSTGAVVSTGGGAVLREENRSLMMARGTVVYLQTSVDEQIRRTAKDRKRPLLQKGNPEATLRCLMAEREPLYLRLADYCIATDHRGPRAVVQELVSKIEGGDLSA